MRALATLIHGGLALLIYLALAAAVFASAWAAPNSNAIGVGGDPYLAIWFMRWTPFALTHHLNPLFTDYLDYPSGVNLMWNTAAPLLGLLFWPITQAGPVLAYNLAETLALALSAWTAYIVFCHFVQHRIAAGLGGLLYGFSPYMMAHALGHPPLILLFTPPLMLLALHHVLIRQHRSPLLVGAGLGILGAAQLLLWEELLASEALVAVTAILWLAALNRDAIRERRRYAIRALGAAAMVFLVLAAIPLGFQFLGPRQVHGAVWPPNQFVTDLLAFIVPTRLQAIAPAAATTISDLFRSRIYEWSGYLGIPLLALLVYGTILYRKDRSVRLTGLLGAFVALLAMGPLINLGGRTTPIPVGLLALALPPLTRDVRPARLVLYVFLAIWIAMTVVPIINDILPSRLTLFVFLFGGLLLALILDATLKSRRPRRIAIVAVMTGLAVLVLVPRQPFPTTGTSSPSFFTTDAVRQIPEGSIALVAPFAYDWRLATPMLWQVQSGMRFRMPEGFAWIPGPSYTPTPSALGDVMTAVARGTIVPQITDDRRRAMLTDLERWHVGTILVGPMDRQDQMIGVFSDLLGRPPAFESGVYVWWQVDASR
jgi:hypothetical protein